MSAGTKEALADLHRKVTEAYHALLDAVAKGGACENCGVVNLHFIGLNPAVLGHINKFLAENDVTCLPVPDSKVDRLKQKNKLVLLPSAEAHERFAAGE